MTGTVTEAYVYVRRTFGSSAGPLARWSRVFVPVALVYLATANFGGYVFIDSAAGFHPAWHLVHHGHLWLDDGTLRIPLFVDGDDGHLFSNRPFGLQLLAVPSYLATALWSSDVPAVAPAAVTMSIVTAAAVANLCLLLEAILSRRAAWAAAVLAGLGTSLWSVAAAEYLPHGVDVLWLTSGLLALHRGRDTWAGGFFGLAILTRPHLALVALVLGIGAARNHHGLRSLFAVGVPAATALLLHMTGNALAFGAFNVRGGYDNYVEAPLSGGAVASTNFLTLLSNAAGTLVSGPRGLLLLSPFLLLLLPGIRQGWRLGPWWLRWAACAGLAYMVVQLRIQSQPEGFLGGALVYSYRYSIESLILCAPLLAAAWQAWTRRSPTRVKFFLALAVLSIWIHQVGAVLYSLTGNYPFHLWLAWSPASVLSAQSAPVIATEVVILIAAVVTVLRTFDQLASGESRDSARATGSRAPSIEE